MDQFIGLALLVLCAIVCSGCSGSVSVVPEEERIGTVTDYGDGSAQPSDGEGGSGGEVGEGGAGGEGGVAQNPPSDDCSADALKVELSSTTPQSQIVAAWEGNTGMWTVFSRYVVSNGTNQDRLITSVKIAQTDPNGDVADFHSVVIAMDGLVQLQSYGQGSVDGKSFVLEQGGGFVVPAWTSKIVEVRAQLAPVVSGSVVGGQWHGVSRSGHTPALSFEEYRFFGEVECVSHKTNADVPPSMVIRKSKPVVEKLALPTNELANTDTDQFKFRVSADSSGSAIALRQIAMRFEKTGDFEITDLGIRRGDIEIPYNEYHISVCPDKMSNCLYNQLASNFESGNLYIGWINEEVITGSGWVYTLHGNVTGAKKGDTFKSQLLRSEPALDPSLDPLVTTGKITCWAAPFWYIAKDGLESDDEPFLLYTGARPYFLWSDLSEFPHSGGTGILDSSADWTTDLLVGDLSGSETLSM